MRSLVLKSKTSAGRQIIKPVEILCDLPMEIFLESTSAVINYIFENISKSIKEFDYVLAKKWSCTFCKQIHNLTNNHIINLDVKTETRSIENLLAIKKQQLIEDHICDSNMKESGIVMTNDVRVCIFESFGMEITLDKQIEFGGYSWKC